MGDKVRLIKNNAYLPADLAPYLGQELTVSVASPAGISFAEDKIHSNMLGGAWLNYRFERVPVQVAVYSAPVVKKAAPARAKNGRFASRTQAPTILRNGSLYLVKRKNGTQVARLKVATRDSKSVVMSRHGKLFLSRPNKLTLAPQSDVDAYLAEAKAKENKGK